MNGTVFEEELKRFRNRLTSTEQSSFASTTVNDLHVTLAGIQQDHVSTRSIVNINRIRKFMEAVEPLTKALDTFTNVSEFVAFIWGPLKYLLLVRNRIPLLIML